MPISLKLTIGFFIYLICYIASQPDIPRGSGMSSLAGVLKDLGHEVLGCDTQRYIFCEEELKRRKIKIETFERAKMQQCDAIVVGNSFTSHPLIKKAKDIPIYTYQDMIAYLVNKFNSLAVCGTHGKTTTTSLIKHILSKRIPLCYLIGDGEGGSQKGAFNFIFEACEYQNNFLNYYPNTIVCTNIDYDHVDYFKNIKEYRKSFFAFFGHAKDNLILNYDDIYQRKIYTGVKTYTYGLNKKADLYAGDIIYSSTGIEFSLIFNKRKIMENIKLPFFGKHFLYDILAAILTCLLYGFDIKDILQDLQSFKMARRRFNEITVNSCVLIDDYGHHPLEIKNTISAIKQKYKNKKIIAVFHPDRYSRVNKYFSKYLKIFRSVQEVYILPFINMEKNSPEEKLINKFKKRKINVFSEKFYQEYSNCILFFTGSKDMKEIKDKITDYLI